MLIFSGVEYKKDAFRYPKDASSIFYFVNNSAAASSQITVTFGCFCRILAGTSSVIGPSTNPLIA